jgi:hypothetical protein
MASKKKTEKKQAKSMRTAGKKVAPTRKAAKNKEKMAKSRVSPTKKLTKKKAAPKNAEVKTNADGKKTVGALKKQVRGKGQSVDTEAFGLEGLGAPAGEQSGDLQGLSNIQSADSESVDASVTVPDCAQALPGTSKAKPTADITSQTALLG